MAMRKPRPEFIPQEYWRVKEAEWQGPVRGQFQYVFFGVTSTNYCMRNKPCGKILKKLQAVHTNEKGLPDIRYNFLIGGDGVVYEARGWNVRPTLPRRYLALQGQSLYVAFIGHFLDMPPKPNMFKTKADLLEFGVKRKYIASKFLEFHV